MSESYQSKRERWQRMLEALPEDLREHVSLRNVEAIASLTPQAQARLTEALRSGLKRLPRAVEQLRVNPDTSLADLLNPAVHAVAQTAPASLQHIQKELADLVQQCFPDMPRLSAEALASADVMNIARQTSNVHQMIFESNHLHTDFVMVVLYALVRQTLERLDAIIVDTPALRQALDRSLISWKLNDWRNQDAQKNR